MIGLLLRSWRVLGGLAVVAFAWPMFPAGARTVLADGWHSTAQRDRRPRRSLGPAATVVQVIDGDTLRVRLADGSTTRARLLMANTPERSTLRASIGHHVDCGADARCATSPRSRPPARPSHSPPTRRRTAQTATAADSPSRA
jgi:endonuclease YncB( thermonuclease family)